MIDIDKLRKIYKFSRELSLSDAQVLIRSAKSHSIKKRTILFTPESKNSTIYFLRKGLVRMYHVKDNGDEITFNLIPENNIVANFEFIGTQKASKFFYETLEDSSLLSLDYHILEDIIRANPKLEANRKFFLRLIIAQFGERLESFVLMSPEERYLKFIKDHPDLNNRVSDKYIAQYLGMTSVSLSRIRKRIIWDNK